MFNVFFDLTRYCNYACSYCWPASHSSARRFPPTQTVLERLASTKASVRQQGYTAFNIALNGGEPTQHPGFLDIIRDIAADTIHCTRQTLHVTTNLSRGMIWWLDFLAAAAPLHAVTISASWHHEIHASSIIKQRVIFAEKLSLLKANAATALVTVVMIPERWEAIYADAMYFREVGFDPKLQPLINERGQVAGSYTEAMRAILGV